MEQSRWATSTENIPIRDPHPSRDSTMDSNTTQQDPKTPANPSQKNRQKTQQATGSSSNDREAALRHELESVRRMNQVIEGVTSSLEKARSNMSTINQTVTNARTLLDTWTRILSQTEHNQRLILNPAWQGASQDLADAENETLIRQRQRERKEAEEAERKAAAVERKRAEEERRRAEAERREAAAAAAAGGAGGGRGARSGNRAGGMRGGGGGARGGRTTPGVGSTGAGGAGGSTTARTGTTAGSGPSRTGRGAIAGYGRVGSVGTKSSRGRGRGVG